MADRISPPPPPAHRPTGAPAHRPTGAPAHFLSNVLAVAYKEASALRRDQAFLAAVMVQPIVFTLLFGFALSFKPANVPWAVLDRSQTAASRRFVEAIEQTGYFRAPRAVTSYAEGRSLLKRGAAVAFVVIPPEFRRDVERRERPRVQMLLDGTDPLTAARVGGAISGVGASFTIGAAAAARATAQPQPQLRQRFFFNRTLRDREFFMAVLAGILLTNLCLSVTSLSMVSERESGTYEYMLASPTTSLELVLGKLLPYVVISYAVLVLALILPGVGFGLWPRGSLLALFVVTLPFVLASLSIGVLVSALASTSAQAVFISVFFLLPSFVLSGSMMPYQLMPAGIREIGYLLPLRWYQIAQRRIIERGGGIAEVAGPIVALTVLFVVILLLIRWRMKPRLA
jgi:ABC-2 type transport system permease protein